MEEIEKEIIQIISKNNNDLLKLTLGSFKGNIDFTDENGKNFKLSVNN